MKGLLLNKGKEGRIGLRMVPPWRGGEEGTFPSVAGFQTRQSSRQPCWKKKQRIREAINGEKSDERRPTCEY